MFEEQYLREIFLFIDYCKINSSLTNKTIQLLNTQTKQKQHKKQQIK
jgi:hypothetical protein